MPKMHVSRSITINKPAAEVFPHLNNFKNWPAWSPWLLMDPDCKLDYAQDNKSYSWEGKRTGSGNMKVNEEVENQHIHYDLNFTKPWKSENKTSFYLKESGDATTVEWTMDSKLPIFLFWMKNSMEKYIGADYERGLDMLKSQVEKGEIHSKLDFKGTAEFPGAKWIGVRTTCDIDATKDVMPVDFGKIRDWATTNESEVAGKAFSIYHKWDIVKNKVEYTAAIPVKNIPNSLPEGFSSGSIPACNTYNLRHIGAYQHLGNAWSTLYTMHRIKEFKPSKKIDPFEIYQNIPGVTPDKELITDIHFPLK